MRQRLLIVGLVLACGQDGGDGGGAASLGTPPWTPPPAATTGPDADAPTTGASTGLGPLWVCPTLTHRCVTRAEAEWRGPVQLTEGPSPACEGPPVFEAVAGVSAAAARCACACGAATGSTCGTATLRVWPDEQCQVLPPAEISLFAGARCTALPSTLPAGSRWSLEPVRAIGGRCEPDLAMETDPPEPFGRVAGCTLPEIDGACDAATDRCLSLAPGPLCLWREGEEVSCPAPYSDRRVVHRAWSDQRSCTACECGAPVGLCPDATAFLFGADCATAAGAAVPADASCVTSPGSSARLVPGDPVAYCSPSPVSPEGRIELEQPLTLCCSTL